MPSQGHASGTHLLLDLYGAKHLSDLNFIREQLNNVAVICGATLLDIQLHKFGEGQGITGVALLAESHISIHTWPEHSYAAIDIFMCGECDPALAVEPLRAAFGAREMNTTSHSRSHAFLTTTEMSDCCE